MKREPTLADLLLSWDGNKVATAAAWYSAGIDNLRTCKQLVLDAQAAQYLGDMVRDHPRIIADAQDFAVPMFDRMWIEFPFRPYFKATTGDTPDGTSDMKIGYLFDGPVVRVASHGFDKLSQKWVYGFVPVEYVLHRPMSNYEELDLAGRLGTSRVGLDLWFWGESAYNWTDGTRTFRPSDFDEAGTAWDKASMRALRDNHTVRLPPMRSKGDEAHFKELMQGSAGDLRNIVSLLLFLNRTHDVHVVKDIGHGRGFVGNKLRPFMAHRVISLRMNPQPRWQKMVAGEGVHRRLHDVRGHYAHDKAARAGCLHGADLVELKDFGDLWVEYKPLHWRCKGCGGERWWRKSHTRGSLDDGLVAATYAVTR